MSSTPELPALPPDGTPAAPSFISPELKEILAFNESENQRHRDFFQTLYKWTAGALTVLVVFIGGIIAFIGWHTISDIRKQAQDATSEEVRETKKQSEKVILDETTRMRQQITTRLDEEFKTERIRLTVGDAARRQTQAAMMPLIDHEVKTQVSSGVRAEQSAIQNTLLSQTRQALDDMKPVINKTIEARVGGAVDTAVKSQVDTQISPRIKDLQDSERMSQLVSQAQSEDGPSFDILANLSSDQNQTPIIRSTAIRTVRAVLQAHNNGLYSGFNFTDKPTPEEKLARTKSPDALFRRAAIDELAPDYAKAHLDDLFTFMMSDPDLSVRTAAYVKFKSVTQAQFLNLDAFTASQWWSTHRAEWVNPKK